VHGQAAGAALHPERARGDDSAARAEHPLQPLQDGGRGEHAAERLAWPQTKAEQTKSLCCTTRYISSDICLHPDKGRGVS
jgi:hypothetical protein